VVGLDQSPDVRAESSGFVQESTELGRRDPLSLGAGLAGQVAGEPPQKAVGRVQIIDPPHPDRALGVEEIKGQIPQALLGRGTGERSE